MSWSQTTLVNPDPPTVLTFSHKSMLNTVLSLKGQPYIKVATVDVAAACTTMTKVATNELVATIKRRTLFSDTVKFSNKYGGKALKRKEWLVEQEAPGGQSKTWTIRTSAGTYVWRVDVVYRLALSPENDPDHPVAYAQFPTHADRDIPFGLVVVRGTEDFWDEIIASFLLLELELQMTEKKYYVSGGVLELRALRANPFNGSILS